MKKIIIGVILILITLVSCHSKDDVKTITIENKYSLNVPSFLSRTNDLNSQASLQFKNSLKEFYVVVVEESAVDFQKALEINDLTKDYKNDLDGYSTLDLDIFKESIEITNVSGPTNTFVNDLPARFYSINGTINGLKVYYQFAFIKGKNNYYQVIAWTLADKENEFKAKMNKILNSFTEV